uniref:hypothetical protein n=1 Tax=Limnohabitans sp. TaxID=1907725 RepID=UPI004047A2B6
MRRWAFALAGFAVGLVVVIGWQFENLEALMESEAQLQALRDKVHAPEPLQEQEPRVSGPPSVMAWWPALGTQAEVWPQLERLMAHYGLRLLSLRPEAPSLGAAWSSQAVALRLQGRFGDWVDLWTALNARGPVWSIERIRITPQGAEVVIDTVLRLWLSPASGHLAKPVDEIVPAQRMPGAVQLVLRAGLDVPVFVAMPSRSVPPPVAAARSELGPSPETSPPALSASAPEVRAPPPPRVTLSPDPADWPLDQVRVGGVWQQAQGAQLILMAGPHWMSARVGQRIGPHGHVVDSIHDQEVHLRAAQGPVWVIGLEKAKP